MAFGALLLVVATLFAWSPVSRAVRAARFLSELSARKGAAAPGTDGSPQRAKVVEETLLVPSLRGVIRARLYFLAERPRGRGIVVAHGVHHDGIDEKRLVPFARALARAGLVVLTPELAELADYRITRSGVDVIRDSALYLGRRTDHVEGERVGLLGFSFAGGLALVAAAEPELRGRLAFVTSVGGHHDLSRVLRFLVTNRIETPTGTVREQAHEYGLVVLLYGNLEAFAPAADLSPLRAAFRAWLEEDRPRARALAHACTTPEGDRLFRLLESQKLQTLAPDIEKLLAGKSAELARLSPRGQLAHLDAPAYLLHGSHDSVIPPSETAWANRELELAGAPHDALVSPLLEHVEVSRSAGLGEKLALLAFIAHLL